MLILLIFLPTLLTLTCSQLSFHKTSTLSTPSRTVAYESLQISQNIIMYKQITRNNTVAGWSLSSTPSVVNSPIIYSPLTILSTEKLRLKKDSKYKDFLYFYLFASGYIKKYMANPQKNLSSLTVLTGLSVNQGIVDCAFGGSFDQTLVLLKNVTSNKYRIMFYNNSTLMDSVDTDFGASEPYLSMQIANDNIHILFQSGLAIYSQTPQLSLIKTIQFPAGSIPTMSANQSILCYSWSSKLVTVLTRNYLQIDSIQIGSPIVSISAQYPYILISTPTSVYQYDIEAKTIIHEHLLNFTNSGMYRFKVHLGRFLVFYHADDTQAYNLYSFLYTNRTNCGGFCQQCPKTYLKDKADGYCIKNYTILEPQWPGEQYQPFVDSFVSFFGKTVSFSSFRISPKQFVSLASVTDELQPYTMHRNKYPNRLKFFMVKSSLINDIKLSAWMLQFIQKINEYSVGIEENLKYSQFLSASPNNPQKVYFFASTEPVYRTFMLVVAVVFVLSKILYLVFRIFKKKHWIFRKIWRQLRVRTSIFCLIISILQPNVSNLTMCSFLQLKLFFSFQILNKLALLACILVLYTVIMYTIAFYPLSYSMTKKHTATHLLLRSNHRLQGYLSEGIYFLNRSVIKTFIHTFLIETFQIQILCLVLVDVCSVYIVLHYRRLYLHYVVFLLVLLYHVSFLLFDFMVYVGVLGVGEGGGEGGGERGGERGGEGYQLVRFGGFVAGILLSIAIFVVLMLRSIISAFKNYKICKTRNLIQNENSKINENLITQKQNKQKMLKIKIMNRSQLHQKDTIIPNTNPNISKIQYTNLTNEKQTKDAIKQHTNYKNGKEKKPKKKVKKAKIRKYNSQNKNLIVRREVRFESKRYSPRIAKNYNRKNDNQQQEDQ